MIPCPGRSTRLHSRFLADHPVISGMRIIALDVGSAELAYESGAGEVVLCSNERYLLEMHKLLTLSPASSYIRDCWENEFDKGRDWKARCRKLSAFNNLSRGKILRNWDDVATYYCILSMSGFNYRYEKWRMVAEYNPVTPSFARIKSWYEDNKDREFTFHKRNIYNFPTRQIDNNTLIYLHLPHAFLSYGCGYVWTQRKLEHIARELHLLAAEGFKVCVSSLSKKWGREINTYTEYFSPDVFRPHVYRELKASRYSSYDLSTEETYFVANF